MARFPVPFLDFEKWRSSMHKPYWLFHNYQVTAAILRRDGDGPAAGLALPEDQAALVSARSVSSA